MYKIRLPNFEGPFDLLLYFIKRDELNIYDIPISKITVEFLSYLRVMNVFDLELAGEFLLMASTLMYIKSQLLLPRNRENEDGEIEDPRTQLVQSLIEYKQIKEAASHLSELQEDQRYIQYRSYFEADSTIKSEDGVEYKNANLFELMKAFQKALSKEQIKNLPHIVNLAPVTVDEKKELIMNKLKIKERIAFFDLISEYDRPHLIATFLALLDLIKLAEILIFQNNTFDDIIISKRNKFNLN